MKSTQKKTKNSRSQTKPASQNVKRRKNVSVPDVVSPSAKGKLTEPIHPEDIATTRVLLNTYPDAAFMMDVKGIVIFANTIFAKRMGVSVEKIIGLSANSLLSSELQWIRKEKIREVIRTGEPARFEDQNGGMILENILQPIKNDKGKVAYIAAFSRDITQQKQNEEFLALQAQVLDSMAEAVSYIDGNGVIRYTNQALNSMFGYEQDELIGKHVTILNNATEQENALIVQEILAALNKNGSWLGEFHNQKKDNTSFYTRAHITALKQPAGDIWWITVQEDITERKRIEADLQASRERLSLVFNTSTDLQVLLSVETDGSLIVREANQAFIKSRNNKGLKNAKENLIDKKRVTALLEWGYSRAQIDVWTRQYHEVIESGKPSRFEEEFHTSTGTVYQDVTIVPILDANKRCTFLLWSAHDITERKQTEIKMYQQAMTMSTLYDTTHDLIVERDLSQLLNIIVERATRLVNTSSGGLYLCEPHDGLVRCEVSYQAPHNYNGITLKYGEGVAGIVAQTKEPLIVENYGKWKGRTRVYKGESLRVVMGVPMKWQGEVIGVLEVSEHHQDRNFTEEEKKLIFSFADQAAVAVHNARLHEQVQWELTKRQQVESELQKNKVWLENIYNALEESVLVVTPDRDLISINKATEKIFGYSADEIKDYSTEVLHVDHEHYLEFGQRINEAFQQDQSAYFEFEAKRKNGEIFPTEHTVTLLKNEDGKPLGIVSVVRDITERKKAGETLRNSERLLRTISENYPNSYVSIVESDLTMGYTSGGEFKKQNLDPSQFIGLTLEQIFGDKADTVRKNYLKTFEGDEISFELFINGQHQLYKTTPLLAPDGSIPRILSVVENITERKRAEEAIRQQEALLEKFFTQSLDGFFFMMLDEPIEWNASIDKEQILDYVFAHQRITKVNDAILQQYGATREQFLNLTPNDTFAHDLSYGKSLWRSLFDDGRLSIKTDERKMDGTPMWIEGEYVCLNDEQGRITGHFGIQREITRQKQMEEDLRIKESALASSVVGKAFTDFNGNINYVNKSWLKMFGYESEREILGTTPREYVQNPADADSVIQMLTAEGRYIGELIGKRRNGSSFNFQLVASMVTNEAGQPIALQGSFLDITERKQAEANLHRSEERFAKVFGSNLVPMSISRLFDGKILDVNPAFTRCFEYTRQELVGKTALELNLWVDPADRERIVQEVSAHGALRESEMAYRTKSGKIGQMLLTAEIIEFDNEQWLLGISVDITERKQAEEALQLSERNYRQLMEQAVDGIFISDALGNYLDVNTYGCELLGYRRDELLKLNLRDILPISDMQSAPLRLDEVLAGKTVLSERRLQRKDGVIVPVELNVKMLSDGRLQAIVRDITERKRSEERFHLAVEAMPNAVLLTREDGEIVLVNAQAEKFFGFQRNELIGASIEKLVPQRYSDIHVGHRMDFLAEPQMRAMGVGRDLYALRKDGSEFSVEIGLVPIETEDGILVMSTVVDITERKQSEKALKHSQMLLAEAQRISHLGSWELDLQADRLFWSDEIYNIFEIDPKKFDASYKAFLDIVHPEDRTIVDEVYTKSIEHKRPYQVDHRLLMSDGRIKYVHEQGETIYDWDGKPLRSIGTVQDITGRKEIEQQLNDERNFTNAIVDNAGLLIVVLDKDGRIRRFNRAAERTSGFSFSEVEGQYPWDTFLPKEGAETIRKEAFDTSINTPSKVVSTYTNHWISKSGVRRLLEWNNTLLLDHEGEVEFMVSMGMDVTERRQAEEALRESEARYARVVHGINDGIWDWNVNTHEDYLSPRWKEILGYRDEELPNVDDSFFGLIHPEDKTRVAEAVARHLKENIAYSVEMRMRHKDGDYRWVLARGEAERDEQGKPTRMAGSITDITARKEMEFDLRTSRDQLNLIFNSTSDMMMLLKVGPGRRLTIENANKSFLLSNQNSGLLFNYEDLIGRDRTEVWLEAGFDLELIKEWDKYIWESIESRSSLTYQELVIIKGVSQTLESNCVPIFDKENHVSHVLWSARDVTERNKIEEDLRLKESAMDSSLAGIVIADLNRKIIYANDAWKLMFVGVSGQDILGMVFTDYVENPNGVNSIFDQLTEFGYWEGELDTLQPDGSILYYQLIANIVRDKTGKPVAILASFLDITIQKQSELRIRENEEKLRTLFNILPIGVSVLDEQKNIVLQNPVLERIMGPKQAATSAESNEAWNYIHTDDTPMSVNELPSERAFKEQHPILDVEFGIITGANGVRWLNTSATPVNIDEWRMVVTTTNITANKKVEKALQMSQFLLNEAQRISHIGSWDLDFQTNYLHWSDENYRIFEVNPRETRLSYEMFLAFIHPDDRERVDKAFTESIENKIPYEITYRLLMSDGRIKFVHEQGETVYNSDGKPLRSIGTTRDITERVRSELAIRESNQLLTELGENLPELLWVRDARSDALLYANNGWEKLLGHAPVIGENYQKLFEAVYPEDLELVHTQSRQAVERGFDEIVRLLSPHGELLWYHMRAFPIYNENSQVYRVAGVGEDITERMDTEQKILDSLNEKEVLLREIHHRVKNNLQVISSLLYLQSQKLQKNEVKDMFIESRNRVISMALIHEMLYHSTDLAHVGFAGYVRDLANSVFQSYGVDEARIKLEIEANATLELSISRAVPIGLIINELVSNSLKHAFPRDRQGVIHISLSQMQSGHLNLTVSDDGVGLPVNFEQRMVTSLGLRLIRRLVDQIEGVIEYNDVVQGTSYRIIFPGGE